MNNGSLPGRPLQPQMPTRVVGTLDEIEMLKMENLAIKVQNIGLQEHKLQQDLIAANRMRHDLQLELERQKKMLSEKYGVDFGSPDVQIDTNGTVLTRVPLPPTPFVRRIPDAPSDVSDIEDQRAVQVLTGTES